MKHSEPSISTKVKSAVLLAAIFISSCSSPERKPSTTSPASLKFNCNGELVVNELEGQAKAETITRETPIVLESPQFTRGNTLDIARVGKLEVQIDFEEEFSKFLENFSKLLNNAGVATEDKERFLQDILADNSHYGVIIVGKDASFGPDVGGLEFIPPSVGSSAYNYLTARATATNVGDLSNDNLFVLGSGLVNYRVGDITVLSGVASGDKIILGKIDTFKVSALADTLKVSEAEMAKAEFQRILAIQAFQRMRGDPSQDAFLRVATYLDNVNQFSASCSADQLQAAGNDIVMAFMLGAFAVEGFR